MTSLLGVDSPVTLCSVSDCDLSRPRLSVSWEHRPRSEQLPVTQTFIPITAPSSGPNTNYKFLQKLLVNSLLFPYCFLKGFKYNTVDHLSFFLQINNQPYFVNFSNWRWHHVFINKNQKVPIWFLSFLCGYLDPLDHQINFWTGIIFNSF